MSEKYFGSFCDRNDMRASFDHLEGDFPSDEEILFASYGGGSYEGDAFVLYQHDGKLYEVSGSHCSCYGLEGQWTPEETSWPALAMHDKPTDGKHYYFLCDHDNEAREAFWRLVESATTPDAVDPVGGQGTEGPRATEGI